MSGTSPLDAAGLVRWQARLIRRQRIAVIGLSILLAGMMFYARAQHRKAMLWRQQAIAAQRTVVEGQDVPVASAPHMRPLNASSASDSYYAASLIGEDGSSQPLHGMGLQVNLGDNKIVEIFLRKQSRGHLLMWSPAHSENKYVDVNVFHPYCANVFALELERHTMQDGQSDTPYAYQDKTSAPSDWFHGIPNSRIEMPYYIHSPLPLGTSLCVYGKSPSDK